MRIDIIHKRDPDYECDHEVWVNGVPVTADIAVVDFWDFDPGRGYDMSEFEEDKQSAVDAAPEFLKERIAKIYDDMKQTYQRWSM